MRKFILLLLLVCSGSLAQAATEAEKLLAVYDFGMIKYSGTQMWYTQLIPGTSTRKNITSPTLYPVSPLPAARVMIVFKAADLTPWFWFFNHNTEKWYLCFYSSTAVNGNNFVYQGSTYDVPKGTLPTDQSILTKYNLIVTHPNDLVPPDPDPDPDPEPEPEPEPNPDSDYYELTVWLKKLDDRLALVNAWLSLCAALLCFSVGLFIWRLIILANSRRNLFW